MERAERRLGGRTRRVLRKVLRLRLPPSLRAPSQSTGWKALPVRLYQNKSFVVGYTIRCTLHLPCLIIHVFFSDKFPSDQFFIVFEFSNGGKDLESFEFGTLSEAWSVLHQTALGLAVAENALEFEHRDLHWGNVLISRTEDEFIEGIILGETKIVPTCGVRVSLIDFTLSRLTKGKKQLKLSEADTRWW